MKRNCLLVLVVGTMLLLTEHVYAQNPPTGSSPTSPFQDGQFEYPLNFNQSPNTTLDNKFNFTRVYTPLVPMSSVGEFDATRSQPILVNTTYTDGWGRSLINVQRNGGTKDIITPFDYRTSDTIINYIPYADDFHSKFKNDVYTRHEGYFDDPVSGLDGIAYSKTIAVTENDMPSVKSYAPGKELAGNDRGTTMKADINDANEVFLLTASSYDNVTNQICHYGYYSAGQLYKNISETFNGAQTIEYTNKTGQLICHKEYAGVGEGNDGYLTTYYVYNELGQLIYTLSPKANEQLTAVNTCLTNARDWCFIYEYDEYGSNIQKIIPGKDYQHRAVYNKLGNLVLTQSPNEYGVGTNKWEFMIYDKLGRVMLTGIYTGTEDFSYWQEVAKGITSPTTHYYPSSTPVPELQTLEYWILNGFNTLSAYPDSLFQSQILKYNYYDDYSAAPANTNSFSDLHSGYYLSGSNMDYPTPYYFAHGKLVASKSRILANGVTNNFTNTTWVTSIYFYDNKNRLIQTQTLNPWNQWDTITVQYNFMNQPVLNLGSYHFWSGLDKPNTEVYTRNTYSPSSGRLIATDQMMDKDSIWYALASYTYNDLGQIKTQWLGGNSGATAELQDFTYDLQGRLTAINSDAMWGNNLSAYNNVSYASRLAYEITSSTYRRYDGRLTGYTWQSKSISPRSYSYIYDTAGRMNYADYYEMVSGTPSQSNTDYTTYGIQYDANGNILKMKQKGPDNSSSIADIDDLTYNYQYNRLTRVVDSGSASPTINDFEDGANGSDDYGYDANGNMVFDYNRDIDAITYNHFDKAIQIDKGTGDHIYNIYDAGGRLLQKTVDESGVKVRYRYWGPFVFKDDTLLYVQNEKGRCRWLKDSTMFKYDYFVKDHQGNVRTVITADITEGMKLSAGFEYLCAAFEEDVFSYVGQVRAHNPNGTPLDLMSARLNGGESDHTVATALMVHVMAGDQVNMQGYGYYENTDSTAMNTYCTGETILTSLADAFSGGVMVMGEGGSAFSSETIEGLLSVGNFGTYETLKANATEPAYPRTYLNYLVFDESMNLLPDECQVRQLTGASNTWLDLGLTGDVTVKENGYLVLWYSGESEMDTWVDNIHFITINGRLMQEQHYYPHGLVIEGGLANNALLTDEHFEGNKLQKHLGLELSDFNFRDYDQQIGRFTGIDLLADNGQSQWSPYHFAGNDPANFVDPLGLRGGFLYEYDQQLWGPPLREFTVYGERGKAHHANESGEDAWNLPAGSGSGNAGISGGASSSGAPLTPLQASAAEWYRANASFVSGAWKALADKTSNKNYRYGTFLTALKVNMVNMLNALDGFMAGQSKYNQEAGDVFMSETTKDVPGREPKLNNTANEINAYTNIDDMMYLFIGKGGSGGFEAISGSPIHTLIENWGNAGEIIHGIYDSRNPSHGRFADTNLSPFYNWQYHQNLQHGDTPIIRKRFK